MRYVFLVLIALFVAIVLAFALQNLQSVTVAFAGLQLTAPLAVLVALVYLFGMATGGGLMSFLRYSLHQATASSGRHRAAPAPKQPPLIDRTPPRD